MKEAGLWAQCGVPQDLPVHREAAGLMGRGDQAYWRAREELRGFLSAPCEALFAESSGSSSFVSKTCLDMALCIS